LTRGPQQLAEVTITAQSSSINALMPPIGEIDLPIGKTVHESIPAGASFPLHLPDFAELEVKVDGKGSFGTAAAISMFDPKAGHFVIWPGERRSEKVLRVPPGQYVVCAYFGVADFPVCDPRQKGAHVIETGLAEVDFSNQLKMAAGTVTVGSAPVEEDLGLAFGASLRIKVVAPSKVELSVNGSLTSNSTTAPFLTVSGFRDGSVRKGRGIGALSESLEIGVYTICVTTSDGAVPCKEAADETAVANRERQLPAGIVLGLKTSPVQ
jgi:hypothetical protein